VEEERSGFWRFRISRSQDITTNRHGTERSQLSVVAGNAALRESRDRFLEADAVLELEHAVIVLPLLFRRNHLGKAPVLHNLFVFHAVQVDVNAGFALMCALSGDEHEISLS
jgi:hypothetical protein